MKLDKITCILCGAEVPEMKYPDHMATVHSGKSQLEVLRQEKEIEQNVPKIIPLEVPLDKEAPVPDEFAEIAKLIDNPPPKEEPKPEPKKPVANTNNLNGSNALELKYVWHGKCSTCNTDVRTIVTKVEERWFVTAYCLTHGEIEQQEVTPLVEEKTLTANGKKILNDKLVVLDRKEEDEKKK